MSINFIDEFGCHRARVSGRPARFMKAQTKRSSEISGFLDQGINLNGELHFSGMLRIDGNFAGSISSADRLIIGERAVVRADITIGEIEIAGQVVGNIVSEWTQILGIVLITKYTREIGSKESRR